MFRTIIFLLFSTYFTNKIACEDELEKNETRSSRQVSGPTAEIFKQSYEFRKQRDAEQLRLLIEKISILLREQSSYQNQEWFSSVFSLLDLIDHQNFKPTICGHNVLPFRGFKAATFLGFLDFERRRYRKSNTIPLEIAVLQEPGTVSAPQLLVTLNLQSLMNFTAIWKYQLILGKSEEEIWKIQAIKIDGACLNSQNFDKNYVKSEGNNWGIRGEGENFMKKVIGDMFPSIPDKLFDRKFLALVDTNPIITDSYNSTEFQFYIQRLLKRYKIRKDLKVLPTEKTEEAQDENEDRKAITNIIIETKNHIVFRTSIILQSLEHQYLFELWDFQIEAQRSNSKNSWKVHQIFVRPPAYYIGNNILETEFLTKYAKGIQTLLEARKIENYPQPEKFENCKKDGKIDYCREEIVENDRNLKIFGVKCFVGKSTIFSARFHLDFNFKTEEFEIKEILVVCG